MISMKLTALAENTANRADLKTIHGLSIYIETPKHKLLFDLGPDDTAFENAEKLGVDLAAVDTVVISHGHFDHGGALDRFLEINDRAKIYIRRQAFEPHFARIADERKFIGLDEELAGNERIIFTDAAMRIDDELFVFSDVDAALDTQSSRALLKQTPDGYGQDDFDHEQNLIVTAEGKAVLFCGCAHRGVDGILPAALRHSSGIEAVFGGFHLYNMTSGVTEPIELVRKLAAKLTAYTVIFYTCHCSGEKAFDYLREIMGEKLRYFSTGTVVEL